MFHSISIQIHCLLDFSAKLSKATTKILKKYKIGSVTTTKKQRNAALCKDTALFIYIYFNMITIMLQGATISFISIANIQHFLIRTKSLLIFLDKKESISILNYLNK